MSLMKVNHTFTGLWNNYRSSLLDILGNELSESFYLIPSGRESSPADLKQQNASLKLEVEALQKRLDTTERILQLRKEQDLHLRDSIFQATREVDFFFS
jgi:hypothetical protein